ncbi:hypothetical protein [Variovorax sp. UC74_104]|uniref:hypothetical protein n=1 Tax=Variovorax sp. UC74_104 TaxID=3374555 RepID=UPI003757EE9B
MATVESSFNPTPTAGNIKLQGKYLSPLVEYVSSLELRDGMFLIAPGPKFQVLKESMARVFDPYIEVDDVQSIVFRQCIQFERKWSGKRSGALSSEENQDLRDELVGQIKSFFESIPRPCTLRVSLPSFPRLAGPVRRVAEDVRLVSVAAAPTDNKLRGGALSLLFYESDPAPDTWLELMATGYADHSPNSRTAAECLSMAKQCAFVLTGLGLCATHWNPRKAKATFSDGASEPFYAMEIPEAVQRLYGRLQINESKLRVRGSAPKGAESAQTLLTEPDREPRSDEERLIAIDSMLGPLRRYFNARSEQDFQQIAAAIEWYQDSVYADNDTFAYIAACVGLEALIGSEDEHLDSLSKRLADRYAFLIGTSRKDREELRQQYNRVLRVRGELVHGKAARLAPKERSLLNTAQMMLMRLIWKELNRVWRAVEP